MKRCPKCKEVKPLSDFGVHRQTKSGLNSHCKVCRAAIGRAARRDPAALVRRLARLLSPQ